MMMDFAFMEMGGKVVPNATQIKRDWFRYIGDASVVWKTAIPKPTL